MFHLINSFKNFTLWKKNKEETSISSQLSWCLHNRNKLLKILDICDNRFKFSKGGYSTFFLTLIVFFNFPKLSADEKNSINYFCLNINKSKWGHYLTVAYYCHKFIVKMMIILILKKYLKISPISLEIYSFITIPVLLKQPLQLLRNENEDQNLN